MKLEYPNKKEDSRFDYKMVIAVRQDLKLPKGKMSAQVAHACVGSVIENFQVLTPKIINWYGEGQKKVVVKVPGLADIMALEKKATDIGVLNVVIEDFGLTQIAEGTITCIGIGPDLTVKIDAITGNLKLM